MIRVYLVTLFSIVLCCNLITAGEYDFDYFVFAQEWPGGICVGPRLSHEHKCAVDSNVTTWTNHGLWPSKWHTSPPGPSFCNKTKAFNQTELIPLWSNLMKFWSNYYKETSIPSLWEHEWSKHGTCATTGVIPSLKTEYDYFNLALKLNRKFDFAAVLSQHGIVPSNTTMYAYTDVMEAFGNLGQIECYYDKTRKTQYLAAVQICLSKDYEQISCKEAGYLSERSLDRLSHRQSSNVISFSQEDSSRNAKKTFSDRGILYSGMPEPCYDTEEVAYPLVYHAGEQ